MARGHRLNTSIVLAAVHGLSGLFWTVSTVELSFFRSPPPTCPPSLISHLTSVDIKQNGPTTCVQGMVLNGGCKHAFDLVRLQIQSDPSAHVPLVGRWGGGGGGPWEVGAVKE